MTLFTKKVIGLGLILLGGLAVAHGAAAGQTWETLVGLLGLVLGVGLLSIKVARRNDPTDEQARR